MNRIRKVTRRAFLVTGAAGGAGLILALHFGKRFVPPHARPPGAFSPNVWLQIAPDDSVSIWVAKSEMGQGVRTSLAMLVAEELDADWTKVRVEPAITDWQYGEQWTSGSTSVRNSWELLRRAGATARAMLVAAAAREWGVAETDCLAQDGRVLHPAAQRQLSFGHLAPTAARLHVPADVPLKRPSEFRLLGRRLARLDTPAKVDGSAVFGADVRPPGLLFANVLQCPSFGGQLRSLDASAARAIPSVKTVLKVHSGVAVLADSTWAAFEGRRALKVEWDFGPAGSFSTADLPAMFRELAERPGAVARLQGNPASALAAGAKRLEATYDVPYLAHVTMEPMDLTADVHWDRCEVWAPSQDPSQLRMDAAAFCRLPTRRVLVHTTFLGGGFGRRVETDLLSDALELSRHAGKPVQVAWTREDDVQHDYYRPAARSGMKAAIDSQGHLSAWSHRCISASVFERSGPLVAGLDSSAVDGAANILYDIPHVSVDYVAANFPVPVGNWRSVGFTQNTFAAECFLDEVAAAIGQDPLVLRLALLGHSPRPRAVLERAAAAADWGEPLPRRRGRGIAFSYCYGSYVAQVAEVDVTAEGAVRVLRMVCAVDCGTVVNPDTVEAQLQGGIVFGLSAALKGEITLDRGCVQQSNFHDYDVLHINETPPIEVLIVPSDAPPGGVGEIGVPASAPALCNAIYAATGKRLRCLPVRPTDLARA